MSTLMSKKERYRLTTDEVYDRLMLADPIELATLRRAFPYLCQCFEPRGIPVRPDLLLIVAQREWGHRRAIRIEMRIRRILEGKGSRRDPIHRSRDAYPHASPTQDVSSEVSLPSSDVVDDVLRD